MKDVNKIEPQFTAGVAEYWLNLGKNSEEQEIKTMLKGVDTSLLFGELERRLAASMALIIGVALATKDERIEYDGTMESLWALKDVFKEIESEVKEIRKAARV